MEELVERRNALRDKRDDVIGELKDVQEQINELERAATAEAIVLGMNEQQRDALAQVLGVDSVSSGSRVGNLGG